MTALQDFVATTSAVFGDAVDAEALWSEIGKMSPGPEAVHSRRSISDGRGPRVRPQAALVVRRKPVSKKAPRDLEQEPSAAKRNIALATNAGGVLAAPGAIYAANEARKKREGGVPRAAMDSKLGRKAGLGRVSDAIRRHPKALAAAGAAGVGLQVLNATGDYIAAGEMNRQRKVANARAAQSPVAKASLGALVRGWRKTSEMQAKAVMPGMQKTPRPVGQGLGPKTAKPKVQGTPIQQARWDTKAAQRSQAAAAGKATRMQTQAPGVVNRHGGVQGVQEKLGALRATQGKASVSPQQRFIAAGQGAKRDFNEMLGTTSGKVAAGTVGVGAVGSLVSRRNRNSGGYDPYAGFGKADTDDLEFYAPIAKFDDEKRLAFGWASVVKKNGLPVLDRQGDYIDIDDVEDAAYVYVEKSRVGGHMHKRTMGKFDGEDAPHHVADMVESMVFTPEKIAKMGLPDDFPTGWWVGYRVFDDDVWADAKSGKLTGFSIHGKGIRKSVDYDDLMGAGR